MQILAPTVMSFLAQRFLHGRQGRCFAGCARQVLGQERQAAQQSGAGGLRARCWTRMAMASSGSAIC
jgi:hypothetical protein